MSIPNNKIAFVCPSVGMIDAYPFRQTLAVINYAALNGYPMHSIGVTERVLVHTARNVLAREALKNDCEWIFWMDSDMILPLETIPKMMMYAKKLDAKFLTGLYYQRLGKHAPLILIKNPEKEYKDCDRDKYLHDVVIPYNNTPFMIDACGFGCVLMNRAVLEALEYPYFRYLVESDMEVSEDYYFCVKAKEKGFRLWAIPEIECGHLGQSPVITKEFFKPGILKNVKVEGR